MFEYTLRQHYTCNHHGRVLETCNFVIEWASFEIRIGMNCVWFGDTKLEKMKNIEKIDEFDSN